ncbi:MAG: hypothetical protein E5W38_17475 [Mesorhizobium sp.]|nr:MAG: hypothetical protein E5W38_17475 [Mesorhizobium sp.]
MSGELQQVEPMIIKGSRTKGLLCLVPSAAFVWLGAYLIRDYMNKPIFAALKMIVAGSLGISFFGLCSLIFAWLIIRPHFLILDGGGFTVGGGLIRTPFKIAWQDVQGFHIRRQRRSKAVGFRFEPSAKPRSDGRPRIEGGLPRGWRLSTEKMVETLNSYRLQALHGELSQSSTS